ncbi:MAG: sugar ABC transporter substrate-binding protein [Lachnospiraceae bacterium]|nr:sugar ABC transporter substrate-binding protein [Lachnospiraceae bacterium]
MKRMTAAILTTAMAVTAMAGTTITAGAEEEYKVLVASSDMSQSFYSWLANSVVASLEAKGVKATLVDLAGDTANVPTVIEQAITDGYNGLVMDKPDHDQNTDELLQEAHDAGVYTILVNNTEVKDGVSCGVGLDNYPLGYTVGTVAAEKLPENAKILILKATAGNQGSEDRYNGFVDALADEKREDVEVLDVRNSDNWSKEGAMAEMEDWLQVYTEFDAVYSMCADMTCGCIEACGAADLDVQTIQFYGIDGLANGCKSIKDGKMTATVLQNATEMGEEAASLWEQMEKGELTEGKISALDPTIITSDNVDEIITMHEANGMMK